MRLTILTRYPLLFFSLESIRTDEILQNGEITDPPADETSIQIRYAQSIPRPVSPEYSASQESLFCQRCLQNQHIVNQALAEYLPAPTASDFSEFEARVPRYRQGLEERYPQVCENCAPGVEARIKATGYAAKTDHLRRMMDRTRSVKRNEVAWSWKFLAFLAGAIGWTASIAGQLLWDGLGVLTSIGQEDGLWSDEDSQSASRCIWDGMQTRRLMSQCSGAFEPVAKFSLTMGLVCIWWNPKMRQKFSGKAVRVLGLPEYYKLQALFLVVRFAAWKALGKHSTLQLEDQTVKAGHAVTLVLTILVHPPHPLIERVSAD